MTILALLSLMAPPGRVDSDAGDKSGILKTQYVAETANLYERMFEQHAHERGPWPLMVEATRDALKARREARPESGVVLDLASGPGEPGLRIAREIPGTRVIVTDVSPDMLSKAQRRGEGVSNASYQIADAQDLSAFDAGSIDVITCCYGYMFCAEPLQALEEARRVLQPGGQIIVAFWVEAPQIAVNKAAVAAASEAAELDGAAGGGPPPPSPPPGFDPLALAKPGLWDGLLAKAGFELLSQFDSEYPFDLGELGPAGDDDACESGDGVAFDLGTLPVREQLLRSRSSGPTATCSGRRSAQSQGTTRRTTSSAPMGV
jgi:SAM-dependent methyltransferase